MPRILVIDDSKLQRVLATSVLEDADFEVESAEDGGSGLAQLRSEPFDCVLLDWLMPGTSGADVLQAIGEEAMQVPVIVVTSDPDEATHQECKRLGAAAIVDKPRNADDLLRVVHTVLGTAEQ